MGHETKRSLSEKIAVVTGAVMKRSGTIQWVEDLAEKFDILDENSKRPPGYPRRGE